MANEQIFKFPGFFEREIDLSQRVQSPVGTPAGIIGTAEKGPAFVPITVGSFADFKAKFGGLDSKMFGPYAVNEFLKHRTAATYMRVLGAGANDTTVDISTTRLQGTVANAGFRVAGQAAVSVATGSRNTGGVVFIAARHTLRGGEAAGFPIFTDNNSFGATNVDVIRGMVMMASGTRMVIANGASNIAAGFQDNPDDATLGSTGAMANKFKLIISSSASGYGTADALQGVRILTCSLNPSSNDYLAKVLNTNPEKFNTEEHLLYAEFPVEDEIASVSTSTGAVMLLSGSGLTSATSGDTSQTFANAFGRFDTRFTTPTTTWFISQPFGTKEFNLFRFETISDGKWANDRIKVSISNIRKSTDPTNPYGTFAVQVRDFNDNDFAPKVIEQFPNCDLNPSSPNYIGKVIGDTKVFYMFDADLESERRLVIKGRFPNKSNLIRVIIDDAVENRITPRDAVPFGFRGVPVINTSDALGDSGQSITTAVAARRLQAYSTTGLSIPNITGSVVPPLPFTYKATRGTTTENPGFEGAPGVNEIADSRVYWGVKTTRITPTASLDNTILNPNVSSVSNPLVKSYAKMLGISKLDTLFTGSGADAFNDNKFSLARVALANTTITQLTGTANQHMREAAYFRSTVPSGQNYTVADRISSAARITLATLVNLTSSVEFNRFTPYAKFTNIFYGGFDGVNILDSNAARMNDLAASSDTGGGADSAYVSPGLSTNVNGTGQLNGTVASYRAAARIMTDELTVNTNILAIPGIRDSFVTDYAALRSRENGLIFYIQDIVEYDENITRLFDSSPAKPDVRQTIEQFDGRALDNNYAAAYFPDVVIDDIDNNKKVMVPPSVAVLGAIAFNDKVGFPWFAPAGFNRAGLDFVGNTDVRLNTDDRNRVYDARVNPIVHFPVKGTSSTFVIFGQKTLQQAKSALDRVNVRRMLLEVKRTVVQITREGFVFEQNTKITRDRWLAAITPRLAIVQAQAGIESFKLVMDESNNTQQDADNNKLNGRIIIVPTRTVEFVALDFVITPTGVAFVE